MDSTTTIHDDGGEADGETKRVYDGENPSPAAKRAKHAGGGGSATTASASASTGGSGSGSTGTSAYVTCQCEVQGLMKAIFKPGAGMGNIPLVFTTSGIKIREHVNMKTQVCFSAFLSCEVEIHDSNMIEAVINIADFLKKLSLVDDKAPVKLIYEPFRTMSRLRIQGNPKLKGGKNHGRISKKNLSVYTLESDDHNDWLEQKLQNIQYTFSYIFSWPIVEMIKLDLKDSGSCAFQYFKQQDMLQLVYYSEDGVIAQDYRLSCDEDIDDHVRSDEMLHNADIDKTYISRNIYTFLNGLSDKASIKISMCGNDRQEYPPICLTYTIPAVCGESHVTLFVLEKVLDGDE